jgi:hypothetical protein
MENKAIYWDPELKIKFKIKYLNALAAIVPFFKSL